MATVVTHISVGNLTHSATNEQVPSLFSAFGGLAMASGNQYF